MKNIKLLLGAVLLIVVAVSCEKSDNGTYEYHQPQVKKYRASSELTKSTILEFEKTVIQSSSKEKQTMELGQAVWKLEAAINYCFRSDKSSISSSSEYNTTFDVPIETTKDEYVLSYVNMRQIYNKAVLYVEQSIQKKNENEYLYVADFSINSVKQNMVELSFNILLGATTGKIAPCTITSADYWYAGEQMGKCGEFVGQEVGKDASDKLEEILNCDPEPVVNMFYTNTGVIDEVYSSEYCFNSGHPDCLSPDEMNLYLDLAESFFLQYLPFDNVMISCEVNAYNWHDHMWNLQLNKQGVIIEPNGVYHHFENIYHGEPHIINY